MRVLLVCGSVSEVSHTLGLMTVLRQALEARGCQADLWNLKLQPLPITDPQYHYNPEDTPDENVRAFVAAVRLADGLAIGTPLYHGSMSGVLKNALDHLKSDAFRQKPVALLSHASEERRCTAACEHLMSVVRTLYGYATQTQIGTTKSDYRRVDQRMVLDNAEILARVERQASELVRMMERLGASPS